MVLVVPVLLMLGGVYVHTVAVELSGETAWLEDEKVRVQGEGERLDVQIAELSEPGRIRVLARGSLKMLDPGGKDLKIYEGDGEDVTDGGGENKGTGEERLGAY